MGITLFEGLGYSACCNTGLSSVFFDLIIISGLINNIIYCSVCRHLLYYVLIFLYDLLSHTKGYVVNQKTIVK